MLESRLLQQVCRQQQCKKQPIHPHNGQTLVKVHVELRILLISSNKNQKIFSLLYLPSYIPSIKMLLYSHNKNIQRNEPQHQKVAEFLLCRMKYNVALVNPLSKRQQVSQFCKQPSFYLNMNADLKSFEIFVVYIGSCSKYEVYGTT